MPSVMSLSDLVAHHACYWHCVVVVPTPQQKYRAFFHYHVHATNFGFKYSRSTYFPQLTGTPRKKVVHLDRKE